jgi:hypothetical protein
MKSTIKRSAAQGFPTTENSGIRRAVGYIRVSTDMQAAEGFLWRRSKLPSSSTAICTGIA